MHAAGLINTLNAIKTVSKPLESYIRSIVKEEHFAKRDILLKPGQIAQRVYFINKGFCRAFYECAEKDYTTWFTGEGHIMLSVYSFFTRNPSFESIEVLEDAAFVSIDWKQLQELYKNFPEFNIYGRIITEQYYLKSEERAIALRTLTAGERYEKLITRYPQILQRATLGQIASHLGISQETLSRIRAKR
ncbi:Crp/Fnr family transcriptional regulator [Mucilaginibacter agri]|uniref:Cyclic nucleotide-binding domain-containing protein n=1 Tax=Mucilaginibacter agri TaxID=2695265 RepID=A0A966DSF5_9SPHI|nr:Crp/Fnr family transcriptional regulator [Mucilaginibacter agri]NCD68276.1 cyclic nucleotide-binding domain-containing protein [Mucilaginibacter agri]